MKKISLLSIGINKYNNLQTLSQCVEDSKNIASSFDSRCSKIDLQLLNDDENLTLSKDIRGFLTNFASLKYSNNDTVIFFFAGHGFSVDGADYLAAQDTDINDLDTAISTDEIIDLLKKSKAGNIVMIIDACRSEVNRSVTGFGERTAELSRRRGVITYFSCSPGETAKELGYLNGGIFTYTFSSLMQEKDIPFTPFIFNRKLIDGVKELCKQNKLSKQTPYTAVAPLEKANYDVFTGNRHDTSDQSKKMVLVLGPSNAGKTTIGQYLAREHGYIHAEMSSFAWKRYNESDGYKGSILDFMENEVWPNGNEDAIAQDFIQSDVGNGKIVVCGARRNEEIETLLSQSWDVKPIYVFANAGHRYRRTQHSSGRYGPSYEEFIKKDLKEFSWGIASMIQMKHIELIINEDSIDDCLASTLNIVK